MRCFWLAAFSLVFSVLGGEARATILTFDLVGPVGVEFSNAYGDNVSSPFDPTGSYGGAIFTPNIEIDYRTLVVGGGSGGTLSPKLVSWDSGFPELPNVAIPGWPSSTGEISFVPDPGYRIVLNAFDLAWWPGNEADIPITYYDASYQVIESTPVPWIPSGSTTITPNLVREGTLRVQFGDSYDHAIDNVDFEQRPARVLVIVLDDVGVELLEAYGLGEYKNISPHPFAGLTPSISALAAQGVSFRNAWANPVCSTTRASMLTGRHAFRHRVLTVPPRDFSPDELTLPEALRQHSSGAIASAAFGKWHVTNYVAGEAYQSPAHDGFDLFRGTPGNINNYFSWLKVEAERVAGGQVDVDTTSAYNVYATTDSVDDTITWIEQQDGPWFVWLALNAAHMPYNPPPSCLNDSAADSNGDRVLQAADRELGWLLFGETIDGCAGAVDAAHDGHPNWLGIDFDNTTVILIGDNGSAPGPTALKGPGKINRDGKGKIYEGGINVPLIVAGHGVVAGPPNDPAESPALVHAVDVFATALDLLGVWQTVAEPEPPIIDGRSLVPLLKNPDLAPGSCPTCVRQTVYTDGIQDQPIIVFEEKMLELEDRDLAIRDGRFKLIREGTSDSYEFYDLDDESQATTELNDLVTGCVVSGGTPTPEEQAAFDALRLELEVVTGLADLCP